MNKRFLALAVLLVAAIIFLWPEAAPIQPGPAPASLRPTTTGPVIGFEDGTDTYAWLGLPFAQPPVGDLRWRAPRLPEPWQEPLEATRFNNACVQMWGPLSGQSGDEGDIAGDEDCLYLNVWAPRASSEQASASLPVMVWIHGGGNTIGTANTYNASVLAGGEDVVVVTINYRLGLFGWMSHPALRASGVNELDGSGNYGILDMIAALQWVQDNISNFGGDPDRVTVFGESAGGRNVYSLMFSPLAKGLFHRAIAQSGNVTTAPLWRAENYSDEEPPGAKLSSREWLLQQVQNAGLAANRDKAKTTLADMSDQQTLEFMHSRSVEDILAGISGSLGGMYSAPQSLRDGAVLPTESQMKRLRTSGGYNAVPLMTGTNRDEAKLFLAQSPAFVERRFGFLPRIRDIDGYNRAAAYMSDHWKATAVDEVARILSQTSPQPIFAYRWDWDEGAKTWLVDYSELIGAGHGMEVAYVFGSFKDGLVLPGFYNDDNAPGRDQLSRQMRSYWAEFAHSGNPGRGRNGDLPQWQPWQNDGENLMLLDTEAGGGLRMVDEPMTTAMLKKRLSGDEHLSVEERCVLYAQLFFLPNSGDDFHSEDEYRALGCAELDPWKAEFSL